jgi:hypothetical protein
MLADQGEYFCSSIVLFKIAMRVKKHSRFFLWIQVLTPQVADQSMISHTTKTALLPFST